RGLRARRPLRRHRRDRPLGARPADRLRRARASGAHREPARRGGSVSHDTSQLAVVIARLLADRASRRRAEREAAQVTPPRAQPDKTELAVAVAKALVLTGLLLSACASPQDADCDALKSDLEH